MGLLRRYEAFVLRRMSRRLTDEQARREAPARAAFNAVLVPWVLLVFLASVARQLGSPGLSLVLYVVTGVMAPFVFVAWRRWSRVRSRPEDTTKR